MDKTGAISIEHRRKKTYAVGGKDTKEDAASEWCMAELMRSRAAGDLRRDQGADGSVRWHDTRCAMMKWVDRIRRQDADRMTGIQRRLTAQFERGWSP